MCPTDLKVPVRHLGYELLNIFLGPLVCIIYHPHEPFRSVVKPVKSFWLIAQEHALVERAQIILRTATALVLVRAVSAHPVNVLPTVQNTVFPILVISEKSTP